MAPFEPEFVTSGVSSHGVLECGFLLVVTLGARALRTVVFEVAATAVAPESPLTPWVGLGDLSGGAGGCAGGYKGFELGHLSLQVFDFRESIG